MQQARREHVNARARRRVVAGVVSLFLAVVSAPLLGEAAVAAESGDWWYDTYDVAEVHAEGWTGEGVKIALFDAQINPDLPVFDGRDLTVAEGTLCKDAGSPSTQNPDFPAIHSTTLAAYLIGNGSGAGNITGIAPEASLTFYAQGNGLANDEPCSTAEHDLDLSWFGWGLQRAIDDGNKIVVNAGTVVPNVADAQVVANAIAQGVVIVDATPNKVNDFGYTEYPWSFNGIVAASAVDNEGGLQRVDNFGTDGGPLAYADTTVVGAGVGLTTVGATDVGWDTSMPASGSSFTAPIIGGMLAVAAQRYPEATGNQLIQSLIHNTGVEDHPLEHDASGGYGYGAAWLTHLLRVDPAQYPDVNPLMDKSAGEPTEAQVAAAAERGSALPDFGSSGEDIVDAPADGGDASPAGTPVDGLFVIAALGGAVIVLGAIALTVVLIARRKRIHQGGPA